MSERFRRHLIGIAVAITILSISLYFGWLKEAPPLRAPGIVP